MLTPALLLGLASGLFSAPAEAREGAAYVFISPFEAKGKDAATAAATLPGYLATELQAHPEVRVIPIEKVSDVHDVSAAAYAASCPPGQFVGCAFVLGDTASADFVVTGLVEHIESGTRAEVHIISVADSEDVLSFQVDVSGGDDKIFAEGVARVLLAVIEGKAGAKGDIRASGAGAEGEEGDEEEGEAVDKGVAAKQLNQLEQEIGGVKQLPRREGERIERPKLTEEELLQDMNKEGAKPWERLNMSPGAYLRYRNSGLKLPEWRKRAQGRKGQVLVRGEVGFLRAPLNQDYYGRIGRSEVDLSVVESYAYQSSATGSGFTGGFSAGYGLLPSLEVGLVAGFATGKYVVNIQAITEGQETAAPPDEEFGNSNLYFGPQVLAGLFPVSSVRPVVGGQFTMNLGSTIDKHVSIPADLPNFDRSTYLGVAGILGVEARLGGTVDAFIHVPVGVVVGGRTSEEAHEGSAVLTNLEEPGEPGAITAGVLAGVQVRLGGVRAKGSKMDRFEDEF